MSGTEHRSLSDESINAVDMFGGENNMGLTPKGDISYPIGDRTRNPKSWNVSDKKVLSKRQKVMMMSHTTDEEYSKRARRSQGKVRRMQQQPQGMGGVTSRNANDPENNKNRQRNHGIHDRT